jgi:hypothetical protein
VNATEAATLSLRILSTKNLMSAPAINALPAPAKAMTLTLESFSASVNRCSSWATTSAFKAFIASGRLIVIVAIPSRTSRSTSRI